MNTDTRFYICKTCGNIIGLIDDGGKPVSCCGAEMLPLTANTTDAAKEKHVPVVTKKCGRVTVEVGSVAHPMEEKHSIKWIYLKTEQGGQRKALDPGDEPKAVFSLTDGDKPVAVYAYCNIHGLWVATL